MMTLIYEHIEREKNKKLKYLKKKNVEVTFVMNKTRKSSEKV